MGGGGGGGAAVGNNITILRTRRVVENNQNAGANLNTAINSSVSLADPADTPLSPIIQMPQPPAERRISLVTPMTPFSPTVTSSNPLQSGSVLRRVDPQTNATILTSPTTYQYFPAANQRRYSNDIVPPPPAPSLTRNRAQRPASPKPSRERPQTRNNRMGSALGRLDEDMRRQEVEMIRRADETNRRIDAERFASPPWIGRGRGK